MELVAQAIVLITLAPVLQAAMTLAAVVGVVVELYNVYRAAEVYIAPLLPERNTTTDAILR